MPWRLSTVTSTTTCYQRRVHHFPTWSHCILATRLFSHRQTTCLAGNANGGLPCTVEAISVRDIGDTASSLASVACRHLQPIRRSSPRPTLHVSILLSSCFSIYTLYVYSQVPCSGDTNLFRASPWCYCRLKRLDIPARTPYLHMQLNPCAQTATH